MPDEAPLAMTRSNFGVRLKRPARSITAKEDPAAENLKASGVRPAAQVVDSEIFKYGPSAPE